VVTGGVLRSIGRFLIVLAVLLPVGVVASSAANGFIQGFGPAVMECGHFTDGLVISPGVTGVPLDQSVAGHGRLYGCNKAGGGGRFSATLHMTHATCADLSMVGSARFAWANGGFSTAQLRFAPQPTAPDKVLITGRIGNGMFSGLVVQAWVRFTRVFRGTGPVCTASNPLTLIEFSNTQSFQLGGPAPTTTTVPQHPTTTTHPSTSSSTTPTSRATTTTTTPPASTTTEPLSTTTAPTTVPVTNAGSTAPTALHQPSGGGTPPPAGPGTPVAGNATGALAFTGSNGLGALVGLESLIIGGAFACLGTDRRGRRAAFRHPGAKPWLFVTLPPRS
jgi:hypothetical protein